MDTKYTGVPVDTSAALEVQDSIPIATAVDNQDEISTTIQLASAKVDKGLESNQYEREDGITITWEKGEVQPPQYRDKPFAILFLIHLVAGELCVYNNYRNYTHYNYMSHNYLILFSTGLCYCLWSFLE